jgi:hypothetical protein
MAKRETKTGRQAKRNRNEQRPVKNSRGTRSNKERSTRLLLEEILTGSRKIEQNLETFNFYGAMCAPTAKYTKNGGSIITYRPGSCCELPVAVLPH